MFVCVDAVYRRWVGRAESATCQAAFQWLQSPSEQQPLALRPRLRQGVSGAWRRRWPHQPEHVDLITCLLHYDTLFWNYWLHRIKEHLFYPLLKKVWEVPHHPSLNCRSFRYLPNSQNSPDFKKKVIRVTLIITSFIA